MLVLSRRRGEEIVIDGRIRLVVLGMRGDKVRLGVCAPVSVSVDRGEIHQLRSANSQEERRLLRASLARALVRPV